MNFLPGVIDKGRTVIHLPTHGNREIPVTGLASIPADGTGVTVGLRPGHFNATGSAQLDLNIEMIEHLGVETYVYATTGKGEVVTIATHDGRSLKAGEPFAAHFDPASALLFDSEGGRIR